MKTKEHLLELFENNKGTYLSGETIAEKLSVSRTAVWKAVKALRDMGYAIDAVPNKGYSLSAETDILSVQGIQKYLTPISRDTELNIVASVNSTNTAVRSMAAAGVSEGYTVIANAQTNGRGRYSRTFYSPADTGIYMSILLRPCRFSSGDALRLTIMAAVAVCEAIESVSGRSAQIKWVNDIYMDGRKVCGILTEASLSLENNMLEYAVVGIGVNVNMPSDGFPDDIKNIAGAIFSHHKSDVKNHLTAEILNRFLSYYKSPQLPELTEKYKMRNFTLGKNIKVICQNSVKNAVAVDIDDDCHLIVEYHDGKREHLSSGEISIIQNNIKDISK